MKRTVLAISLLALCVCFCGNLQAQDYGSEEYEVYETEFGDEVVVASAERMQRPRYRY